MRFPKVFPALVLVVVCGGLSPGLHGQEGRATQLIAAAVEGRIEDVQTALAAGVSPNVVGEDGVTPLVLAARNGRTDVVALLLQRGAKLTAIAHCDEVGCRGHTPLMAAVLSRRPEIVRSLLKAGAKADDLNSETLALANDRFFTRVEAGGASGLVMFEPATAEATLLVSSRRNPALTPLDAPGLSVGEFGVNAGGEISVTCRNAARETVARIYNPATKAWREPGGGEESFAGPTLPPVTGFSGSGFGLAPGDLALIRRADAQTAETMLSSKPYCGVALPCGRAVLPNAFHMVGFWLVP